MMTVTWLAIPRDGVVCDVPVDIAQPIAGVKWYPSSTYHSWLDAYYDLSSDDYNGRGDWSGRVRFEVGWGYGSIVTRKE